MDLLLTGWRVEHEWLAAGSQNAQSETVRDFCRARRDGIKARKPGERRGHPRLRSRRRSLPTLPTTCRTPATATAPQAPWRGISGRWHTANPGPASPDLTAIGRRNGRPPKRTPGLLPGVRSFDQIADEDFRPRFMAANRSLSRRAADAAVGQAQQALRWMVLKHDREHALVNYAFSTMDCSACGSRAKTRLPLSQRTYLCDACGHVADRDSNAANVMLARAGFDPAGAERVRQGLPLAA